MLGIHGCYWVQENRLKFYALSTIIAIVLEAGLGSMSIIKEQTIVDKLNDALSNFENMMLIDSNKTDGNEIVNPEIPFCDCTRFKTSGSSNQTVTDFRRLKMYATDATYKNMVDHNHTILSCCSFPSQYYINVSCCSFPNKQYIELTSCYHQISGNPLPECRKTVKDNVSIKLIYIRCLAFMLVPIQLFCLGFDLMVLKTLQVTREYDKLERELSNKRREKRNSMGYTTVSDVENIAVSLNNG